MKPEKQDLLTIRRNTSITTGDIAREAHLSIGEVYIVEIGGSTSLDTAQLVVKAFNRLTGMHIGLEDINVHCQEHAQ
jgi:hypothetical protein